MNEFDLLPFILDISPDKMRVTFSFSQENFEDGSANPNTVLSVLRDNGIVHGVKLDVIQDIFSNPKFETKYLIAEGIPPIPGDNGKVDYMYDPLKNLTPKDNGKGFVNYKDLGFVRNIVEGTIIANIILPSQGTSGVDVFGEEIPPKQGIEARFKVGKNAVLTDDGLQILAGKDGNLEWDGQSFNVSETLVINQDVGAATGNIDFIGNVIIKGSVSENFTVISKKSIIINGTVVGATLIADGSISIALGVIKSSIISKQDVKINFAETSKIECDGNFSSSSCIGCDIFCGGLVEVISGRGVIVGGRLTAVAGIKANVIGSENFTKTTVMLGKGAILSEERNSLLKKHKSIEEQITKLEQAGLLLASQKKKLGTLPPEKEAMQAQVIRQRFTFLREIKEYEKRVKDVEELIKEDNAIDMLVKKHLWNGVNISIGTRHTETNSHYTNIRCFLDTEESGDIVFDPVTGRA